MTLSETSFVCDKTGNPIAALLPLSLYAESARLHEQHFDVRSGTDSLGADHNRLRHTSLALYQPHPRLEIRRHRAARNDSLPLFSGDPALLALNNRSSENLRCEP